MKIRSITAGINWDKAGKSQVEAEIAGFFKQANRLFEKHQLQVRTNRLNLPPFEIESSLDNRNIISIISWLSAFCRDNNIRWFCVPFNTFASQITEVNSVAIEIAKRYKNAFINYIVSQDNKINTEAILSISKFIKSVSRLSNNGYDNFRVGTSFNCKPNSSFFPFTYHEGDNGFSIAPEMVPLFIKIIKEYKHLDISHIRKMLINEISDKLNKINAVCEEIEKITSWRYYGIDVSLAPFPDNDDSSVARLIELLGVDAFGSHGTVFFTSFLTDILRTIVDKAKINNVGFNGVMYSLLEDTRLGINSRSKEFSIDSLLAYCSVCGCGIDMVPVPGDIFEEEIASLMLDVAGISNLRCKPLGFRILPIPTKHANEFTEFSYDFLHNTRIKGMKNKGCFHSIFENKEMFSYLSNQKKK